MRVIFLDNRDSFVYNLVDLTAREAAVQVFRNTTPTSTLLKALVPTEAERAAGKRPLLILSPGPGHPRGAGNMMEILEVALREGIPTLGICLGFQAMVEACGGVVGPVGATHGRTDRIELTEAGIEDPAFSSIAEAPRPGDDAEHGYISVARYHSLGTRSLPDALVSLAHTRDGIVMAARHRSAPCIGLQFHPESILTPAGPLLLRALLADLTLSTATNSRN